VFATRRITPPLDVAGRLRLDWSPDLKGLPPCASGEIFRDTQCRFMAQSGPGARGSLMSASLIGHSGSSTFRLSHLTVSMSLAGSCFSSESAPAPFHHGIRRRGGTIFWSALPSIERQDQADMRTHLIHRPARDILPLLGGSRIFSYRV